MLKFLQATGVAAYVKVSSRDCAAGYLKVSSRDWCCSLCYTFFKRLVLQLMFNFLQETIVVAYVKVSSRDWCCSLC